MLKSIKSSVLRKNLIFDNGINSIVGDELASNSIGKSSSLLVIDFAFGGKSLLKEELKIVEQLGNHYYEIEFAFDDKIYKFIRYTDDINHIFAIENNVKKPIKSDEYCDLLMKKYELDNLDLSFRGVVSPLCRIAGKDEIRVKKPLDSNYYKSGEQSMVYLLKLFSEFKFISEIKKSRDFSKAKYLALNKASEFNFVKKISKSTYNVNKKTINELESEINLIDYKIKNGYKEYDSINDDILQDLKNTYRNLKTSLRDIEFRLSRIKRITGVTDRQFDELTEYFENINMNKLKNINEFQKKIFNYYNERIARDEQNLKNTKEDIIQQIKRLQVDLDKYLDKNDSRDATEFINRRLELEVELRKLRKECSNYEDKENIKNEKKRQEIEYTELLDKTINKLEKDINLKLVDISNNIQGAEKYPPIFHLHKNDYELINEKDTGTGTKHTNIVMFDLMIAENTKMPFIIHDSIVHKQMGRERVERTIRYYQKLNKQVFISIDEIQKYSSEIKDIIEKSKVVELSKDNVLFISNWSMHEITKEHLKEKSIKE